MNVSGWASIEWPCIRRKFKGVEGRTSSLIERTTTVRTEERYIAEFGSLHSLLVFLIHLGSVCACSLSSAILLRVGGLRFEE